MIRSKILKSYLKIAIRNLIRNPFYSIMNICGLGIGISCFLLIVLFVKDELSYDAFHTKKDRIYRVCEKLDVEEGQGENSSSQPFPVAPALCTDYPQLIEKAVRFFNFQQPSHTLQFNTIMLNEKRTFFADSSLFQVFDFPLVKGDPNRALSEVNSIVISQETAKKYFGDEDPMGKILKYDGRVELMVKGVFEKIPTQSHIHFDCLISFSTLKNLLGANLQSNNWVWNPCWTYVLLKEGVSQNELEAQFPSFIKKYFPDFIIPQATLYLQKLSDIHLSSKLDYELEPNSDKTNIFIFGIIGVFILVIACINFMNLSTARSAKRAKEIGMRKVFGSYRSHLVQQFLGESALLSFLSLFFAVGLTILLVPLFNSLSGKQLSVFMFFHWKMILVLLLIAVLVGFIAGIYPALFLSAFEPIKVLKGTLTSGRKSNLLRKSLVVLQFSISLALIVSTLVIYKQLIYLRSVDLGFKKDQVLIMPVRPPMAKSYLPFMEEIRNSGRVINVATMNDVLGTSHNTHEYNYEGMPQNKKWIYFPSLIVSPEFIQTLNIKLVAGRDFNKYMKTDDSLAVIINEAMVKHLGWRSAENAIGKQFFTPSGRERVIGVVRDFNFVSLKESVGPFVLDMANNQNRIFWSKYIVIRIPANNIKGTISFIEKKWNEFSKEYPFDYFFLDDSLAKLYQSQDNLAKLVGYFSILAILIACLGLFALASFSAEQRTKEIGVRKVFGASSFSLVRLMSVEFLKLVFISAAISWPVTWVLMNNWLDNFAYRVNMNAWMFILSGAAGLLIALSTVLFQAIKVSVQNPTLALKYE